MTEETLNALMRDGLGRLKISRVMSRPVHTVRETADLSRVEQEFIEFRIRHMPVIDENNRLIGIVSQRDIYRTVAPRKNQQGEVFYEKELLVENDQFFYDRQTLDEYILCRVMRKDPETLTEENSVKDAIHLMVKKKIGCVPIINEQREVVGIVTRHDILDTLEKCLSDNASLNN
ncbi:MAG: HPP family protein [Candidatus Omnitrophota bacterium]